MQTAVQENVTATQPELSLVRGGPFYRAQQSARLIRPDEWNSARRMIFAIALTWVPLVLLTVLFRPEGLASLLRDYRVYSRLFIAIPVLLLGQPLMDSRFRMVMQHILEANLLGDQDLALLNRTKLRLLRLRDALLPEATILLLVVVHTATSFRGMVDATPWLTYGVVPQIQLTPAGWYAVLVSGTVFQFLLGLALWKWLLWSIFAFQLSRLNLRLFATHPDGHGGLGFLALTAEAFTPISFAASTVIGSTWRYELPNQGLKPTALRLPAIVLLAIIALVALGPLAFFVRRLAALRRLGMEEYGVLGQIHSAEFHQKWINHRAGHEEEFLTASEIGTLSGYSRSYNKLERLNPFPADKANFIELAISVVVPMLPVLLTMFPVIVIVKDLLKALR